MQKEISQTSGLDVLEASVEDFIIKKKGIVEGVVCEDNKVFF